MALGALVELVLVVDAVLVVVVVVLLVLVPVLAVLPVVVVTVVVLELPHAPRVSATAHASAGSAKRGLKPVVEPDENTDWNPADERLA